MKITNSVFIGAALAIGLTMSFLPSLVKAQALNPSIVLCEITRSLGVGSVGEDVKCLQRYLNWAGFTVASAGAGSAGSETQYYGPRTMQAVARWQEANASQVLVPLGLIQGTGFWGSVSFGRYVQLVKIALGVQ